MSNNGDGVNFDVVDRATEMWPLDDVRLNPRNARQHTPHQIDQLARSLTEYGWTFPILVDEMGEIIAGHGRWLAGKKLGVTQVPVIVARGWSDEQKRAYMIADNKLAENAVWDETLLAQELAELKRSLAIDLDTIGFSEDELTDLFKRLAGPNAPDEFPAFDSDIEIEHVCPKCGYKWSG